MESSLTEKMRPFQIMEKIFRKQISMKAIITKVSHGRKKGEFRFKLVGKNGEVIATSGSETYTQKHNVTEVLGDYFSNFTVVDKTK